MSAVPKSSNLRRELNDSNNWDPFSTGKSSLKKVSTAQPDASSTQEVALWLLGSAVEASVDGYFITDADLSVGGRIIYVNPAFTRITGYELSEVIGKTPAILRGPETDPRLMEATLEALTEGREFGGESTHYRKDQTTFIMSWSVVPLKDTRGQISHYLTVMRDVTEQRRSETVRKWLEVAIERSDIAVVVYDKDLRVQLVNPAFEKLAGVTSAQARKRPIWRLPIRPRRRAQWRELTEALTNRGFAEMTFEHQHSASAARLLELNITAIRERDDRVAAYIARCSDVTEQRRMESVTEAVNMSESLGYVFSGIRHELGNPINSIKAALSVLRSGIDRFEGDRVKDYLDSVLLEVGRVEDLLRSLRSFTAFERPSLEPVDAHRFLQRFKQLVSPSLRQQGISIRIPEPTQQLLVAADPRALHQILLNLINNAADAVKNRELPRIELRVSPCRGQRVRFDVIDNGIGFDPIESGRLIQPFYTTKKDGNGLGLSISQKLLSSLGGSLELTGKPGLGCRATMILNGARP
ncbi:MAG: PAS domain S-box protein [Acidobacteriota bacterium]